MGSARPRYLLDATAIIHFAKIRKLNLLLDTCDAHITPEVYREVVERGHGKPDARVIQDAVRSGQIKVYEVRDLKVTKALARHHEIHPGEAETLAAAKELGIPAVVDDAEARAIAKAYGISTKTGTLFLLFKILALGSIKALECSALLDQLVQSGLYVDSNTLISAKRRIFEKST